ncbi:hypothetical protein pb186bvf_004079 [Paramecium bursaria]
MFIIGFTLNAKIEGYKQFLQDYEIYDQYTLDIGQISLIPDYSEGFIKLKVISEQKDIQVCLMCSESSEPIVLLNKTQDQIVNVSEYLALNLYSLHYAREIRYI